MKMGENKKIDVEALSGEEFAKLQYEPNSFRTKEKMLWAAFRMNVSKLALFFLTKNICSHLFFFCFIQLLQGIEFSSSDFSNYRGSYKKLLHYKFNKTAKIRADYGTKKT